MISLRVKAVFLIAQPCFPYDRWCSDGCLSDQFGCAAAGWVFAALQTQDG